MKNKFFYIYYFFMILVLALYTNMSKSPNIIIRIAYLVALITPLITSIELLPAVLICTLVISQNTFAYPFMPTENYYYLIILLFFAIIEKSQTNRINHGARVRPLFLLLLIYVFLNDIFFQFHLSRVTITVFECILMFVCIGTKRENSNKHISLGFMMVSLVLSYWVLFRIEARIGVSHSFGDMESGGWTDANYLGGIIGIGSVIAVKEILQNRENKTLLILCLATLISSFFSLAYLASRGAFLAVSIGIMTLVLFSKAKQTTKTLIILSIIALIVLMYTSNYFDLLIARVQSEDVTGTGRTIIWAKKLDGFLEEGTILNWLFGYGHTEAFLLGNFGRPRAFHNDFIAVLVEYGFVGLGLFIALLLYPIRKASKQMRPTISVFVLYLMVLGLTLEPLTGGNIAFLGYFFYITQMARNSQYEQQVEQLHE